MAKQASFYVESQVHMQEVDNALNQAVKEITTRFDFRGSKVVMERKDEVIHLEAEDDMKLRNIIDVLQAKMVKRGISVKSLKLGKVESSLGGRVKQDLNLQVGLDREQAKKITTAIKDSKLKVQASVQGDSVRITGKKRDDLQEAIAALKGQDFDFAVQFTNYR